MNHVLTDIYYNKFLLRRKQTRAYLRKCTCKQCQTQTDQVITVNARTQKQVEKETKMFLKLLLNILLDTAKDNCLKQTLNLQNSLRDSLKKWPKRYHQWPGKENDRNTITPDTGDSRDNPEDSDSEYDDGQDLSTQEKIYVKRAEDYSISDGATVEVTAVNEVVNKKESIEHNEWYSVF